MFPDLAEIKRMRKRIGMTQSELARLSGVSQSLLAKIESERINPTYAKTVQIFKSLERLSKGEGLKAKDVMNASIIGCTAGDSLLSVIREMKEHGISQLPVIHNSKPVGIVTETAILERIAEGGKAEEMGAEEVMEDCPPIISPESGMDVVAFLLRYFPIVLVSKGGRLLGIVTKADILEKVAVK